MNKKLKSSTIVCSTESITHDCDILYYQSNLKPHFRMMKILFYFLFSLLAIILSRRKQPKIVLAMLKRVLSVKILFSKFRLSCYTLFITRRCNSCVEVIYYFQFSSLHNLKKSFNYLLKLFLRNCLSGCHGRPKIKKKRTTSKSSSSLLYTWKIKVLFKPLHTTFNTNAFNNIRH